MRFKSGLLIGLVSLVTAAVGYLLGTSTGDAQLSPEEVMAGAEPRGEAQAAVAESGSTRVPATADSGAKFTHFRVGNRNVKQLLPDGDVMWVGTSGGVIRYDIRTDDYRLYDLRSGLLARGVFHLSMLNDRLVVGTYGGGMSIYDEAEDRWDNYNVPEGLGDAFVYDVLTRPNGDIWIATWSGANRVRGGALDDRGAWELHTVENTNGGLPNDWVYGLAEGAHGELWLATEGGLARFDGGVWDNWDHRDGQGAEYDLVRSELQFSEDPARVSSHHQRQKTEMGLQGIDVAYNPNYIVALLVDDAGAVWAGTWGGGLARFDGASWINYTVRDGLPANHVFSLYQDAEGVLWVGTSAGLARMTDSGFDTFSIRDGLFSEVVFSMATAGDGSRWVGGYGGVARIAELP